MLKKYLLYLLFSLIVTGMVELWWNYKKHHPSKTDQQMQQVIQQKIQADPNYQQVKDLQDLKKSVTE